MCLNNKKSVTKYHKQDSNILTKLTIIYNIQVLHVQNKYTRMCIKFIWH